jgi:hypothetical protein
MILIRNKQNNTVHRVTPEMLEAIYARGDQWRSLYEVITEPPVPKEIKKLSGKQKPESDNDGLSIDNDGISQQDAGEIQ